MGSAPTHPAPRGLARGALCVLVVTTAVALSVAAPAVGSVKPAGWTTLAGSAGYTCGIRSNGSLWCWGANGEGQLGLGHAGGQQLTPAQVGTSSDWVDVTAYDWSTCGVRGDGTLWCWGYNGEGQLGDGTESTRVAPEQIGTATTWASVDMGKQHACAVTTDGTLWCWGSNFRGALGDGTSTDHHTPEQVGVEATWATVTSGWFFSCATRSDGTLWCWGAGSLGQLGNGGGADHNAPVQVGARTDWASVAAGGFHACAITMVGTLWCWGTNRQGQLGLGRRTFGSYTPRQVGTGAGWGMVTSQYEHTCGVRTDGTAWCWGKNYSGALGGGFGRKKYKPQQVGSATTWKTVGAGSAHTCGAYRNGAGWCWGSNASGELGNGRTEDSPYPTRIRPS